MDDQNFDDSKSALEWIRGIESPEAKVREADIYPILREWIGRISPTDILDVGAGQGICSANIELANRNYTGLEPSRFMVDRANELYRQENKKFVFGNVYAMPFSNGSFDAAFSVSVWHLLGELSRASKELSRVLNENGHFLIITANPSAYSLWKAGYTETVLDGHRLNGKVLQSGKVISNDILYLHTSQEIETALKSAGLHISKVEEFRPNSNEQCLYICIQGQKVTVNERGE